MSPPGDQIESIAKALEHLHPELARLSDLGGNPVYLVGGAVRDLLLGRGRTDIDLVVLGDATALAGKLGIEFVAHERFGTAKVALNEHELDIATARAESYPHPGALPVVEPAVDIEADLHRRDFTINAMAIPLTREPVLIDPYGGQADLATGQLRILHNGSFIDDPTRAIRAARYAARFGFRLEQRTAELLRRTDLRTVSADRREAELLRLAGEENAEQGFVLLAEWGLVELGDGSPELAGQVATLLDRAPWRGTAPRDRSVLAAALGPPPRSAELAAERPERPSDAVALASRQDPIELVIARALGAEWLDRYLEDWRDLSLEIDGEDLIAAGLKQGPALGKGLQEALRQKLDGEITGREAELAVALKVARSADGVA